MATYSACRDVAANLISEPSTGTSLDITATDQIRPIATTTAIPIHARICFPSASRTAWHRDSHIFRRRYVRQFTVLSGTTEKSAGTIVASCGPTARAIASPPLATPHLGEALSAQEQHARLGLATDEREVGPRGRANTGAAEAAASPPSCKMDEN
jgi:hypothetical protein